MVRKTFKIITFGCRTNQAESRMIGEKITILGYYDTRILGEADVVVINTCCVTGKAEKEVRQEIRRIKRENPDCFLAVAGCWVNKIKTKSLKLKTKNSNAKLKILEKVDLLVTNEDKKKILQLITQNFTISSRRPLGSYGKNLVFKDKYATSKKALVKIQDGCDNFCTYCIVPHVRGRSVSRPAEEIVEEIRRLIRRGIEEVVLTGIDIASYKFKIQNEKFKIAISAFAKATVDKQNLKLPKYKNHLVKLVRLILAKTKVKKISFGSMGVEVFDEEFIEFLKNGSLCSGYRLSSHFHIPIQSGCDATLKRMGRGYKISNVKFLISKLKKKVPDFTFSTDIIVGFPGETEEEFRESLGEIRGIREILGESFTKIHVFRYSSRNGTAAAKLKHKWGRVDEKTKKKRAAIFTHLTNISNE